MSMLAIILVSITIFIIMFISSFIQEDGVDLTHTEEAMLDFALSASKQEIPTDELPFV